MYDNIDHVRHVGQGLLEVCQARGKADKEQALEGLALAVAALARQVRHSVRFSVPPEDAEEVFRTLMHDAMCLPTLDDPVFEEQEEGTCP